MIQAKTDGKIDFKRLRKQFTITPDRLKGWAAFGLDSMQERMTHGLNIEDKPAKPYSKRGPIYIPVTGFVAGRTKDALNGRGVLTRADIRRARKQGWTDGLTATRKTMKFENYSVYKQFLGKSGARDWEVSGAMRRSIGIVSQNDTTVTIGFLNEEQAKKMAGNNRIDPVFGLSPNDRQRLHEFVSAEIRQS
jgi:hypothetical protein